MDATSKCYNAQEGQAAAVTEIHIRQAQALPDSEAFDRRCTILGLSGMVANLIPINTEDSLTLTLCLRLTFTPEQLMGIFHIATDNPSAAQWDELKSVCTNLQLLSLDPMHICYKFDRAQGKVKSIASFVLRRIMDKFACRGADAVHVPNATRAGIDIRFPHGTHRILEQL